MQSSLLCLQLVISKFDYRFFLRRLPFIAIHCLTVLSILIEVMLLLILLLLVLSKEIVKHRIKTKYLYSLVYYLYILSILSIISNVNCLVWNSLTFFWLFINPFLLFFFFFIYHFLTLAIFKWFTVLRILFSLLLNLLQLFLNHW